MSQRIPSWVKNILVFGGMSMAIILCNEGCKPLQKMKDKKAEKKQTEYNEIYNKAYNAASADINRKNDSIANVNARKSALLDSSKCVFYISNGSSAHER